MKILSFPFLLWLFIYMFSFARHEWVNNNKMAAVGASLLGAGAITLTMVLFFGNYEL